MVEERDKDYAQDDACKEKEIGGEKWIKYDDRTIIPKHHPYGDCWIIPKGSGYLKYCPYCMKLIQY